MLSIFSNAIEAISLKQIINIKKTLYTESPYKTRKTIPDQFFMAYSIILFTWSTCSPKGELITKHHKLEDLYFITE